MRGEIAFGFGNTSQMVYMTWCYHLLLWKIESEKQFDKIYHSVSICW